MEFPGVDPRRPMTIERSLSCARPMSSAKSDDAVIRDSLQALERFNIFAVISGELARVEQWRAASPQRVTPAI
jgi:hypothetical protein